MLVVAAGTLRKERETVETVETVERTAMSVANEAGAVMVVDAATYAEAGAMVVRLRAMEQTVHRECDPLCESAYLAHKQAVGFRSRLLGPLAAAVTALKRQMMQWEHAEKARARQETLRLEQEQWEAEQELRAAEIAAAAGDEQAVSEIEAMPPPLPPVVTPDIPKVGVRFRTIWEPEVVDADLVPRQYMIPDMAKLRKVAAALKGDTNIPGVVVRPKRV